MAELAVKRNERELAHRTALRLDRENFCCGLAVGKLAKIASVIAKDRGGTRIIKSVYNKIDRTALDRLLHFDEFSDQETIIIEIWLWKPRAREPFARKKLLYNRPDQQIYSDFKKFVK